MKRILFLFCAAFVGNVMAQEKPAPDAIPVPDEPEKPAGPPPNFPEIPKPQVPQSPFPAHPEPNPTPETPGHPKRSPAGKNRRTS